MATFGDIRSLLHRPPSLASWRRLVELLDEVEVGARLTDEILPYVSGKLQGWDDALLVAPGRWVGRAMAGRDEPRLALARKLRFEAAPEPGDLRRLADHAELGRLVELDLSWFDQVRLTELAPLLFEQRLPGLRRLALDGMQLGDGIVEVLGASSLLEQLEVLELNSNALTDAGVQLLADELGPRLRELDLCSNAIGDAGMIALARSVGMRTLCTLSIWDNRVGDAGVVALVDSGAGRALRALDLQSNRIGDVGARALARWPQLGALDDFDLGDNPIGQAGVEALARSPWLDDGAALMLERLRRGSGA